MLPNWFSKSVFTALAVFFLAFAAPAEAAQAQKDKEEVATRDLQALAATLEDDARRQELIARIKALIAVRQKAPGKETPDSLSAIFIAMLSERLKETSGQLAAAVDALSDFPLLFRWLRTQAAGVVADVEARNRLLLLMFKLAVILAAGLAADRLTRFLLLRPRRALESREVKSLLVRVLFLLARTVLDVMPIAVFAGAAYLVAPLVQPGPMVHKVALTFIYAYLIARGILVVVRMVLVPAAPSLRVLAIGGETANYLFIWSRRLVKVTVFGYFLAEAALLLGLPASGHEGLLRLLGLVVTALVAVFILQNRVPVAAWIRGAGEEGGGAGPSWFVARRLRRRFAGIWHVLAVIYMVAVFGVWAMGIEDGFKFIVQASVVSLLILGIYLAVSMALRRAVERGFAINKEIKKRYPTLESRANRYLPVLRLLLQALVAIIAGLAFLQAWSIDAFSWLETPIGQRLAWSAFSIAVVVAMALAIWEATNSAIEYYLSRTDEHGNMIKRGARARTLLPLLRNLIFVVLAVMVTMIVLSELGVNIAPLLAGAGVVGLAVGFGAQKLVQDVITGAFILFEDSVSVGDVVKVAGNAGFVEALSIRSIRLRDFSGNVHTIPFSTVETVTNMTKEFSYRVFEVGVAYREDTDEVMEVLKEIGAEMQADPEYGPCILEPLDVVGVERFDDSAVIIKARFKTAPIKQWFVGREFNRRMKRRFDELGIEIPFPHSTLYFGEDKGGNAPVGRVVVENNERRPAAANKARRRPSTIARVDLPTGEESGTDGGADDG